MKNKIKNNIVHHRNNENKTNSRKYRVVTRVKSQKYLVIAFVVIFIAFISKAEGFPQNTIFNKSRCDVICNQADHNSYAPQACQRECPGELRSKYTQNVGKY